MASPVVIDSSSPVLCRLPSITPPSRRGSASNIKTSSPDLPSPSTFLKTAQKSLKSGSRVQAAPVGAGSGFATAGSLWRQERVQQEAIQGAVFQRRDVNPTVQRAVEKAPKAPEAVPAKVQGDDSGKLKKPRKTAKKKPALADRDGELTLHLQDFVCNDGSKPGSKSPDKVASDAKGLSRRSSVDLSDFTYGVYNLGMQTQAPAALTAAKKTRKKAAVPKERKVKPTAVDKPRKRKAKSESIILNSDDVGTEDSRGKNTVADQAPKSKSRVPNGKGTKKAGKGQPAATGVNENGKISPPIVKPRQPSDEVQVAEKSVYFAGVGGDDAAKARADLATVAELPKMDTDAPSLAETVAVSDVAAPRRTDWTPAKNTDTTQCDEEGIRTASPLTEEPRPKLSHVISDFGYTDSKSDKPRVERTASGEAVTKRRRIELAESATIAPAAMEAKVTAEDNRPAKAPKKSAGRKKIQTITGLATAAYQAHVEKPGEQTAVSEFFAPRTEPGASGVKGTEKADVDKVKKPRKARKKKADVVEGQTVAAQPKKTKKSTVKVKVKFNELDCLTKLYSPSRATRQMEQQQFLFGTSSQLAVDESPAFIQDMQVAVQASEMDFQAQSQMQLSGVGPSQATNSPRKGKSCAKVPSAPHGTCLSLEQAQRELWCVSARDDDGELLRESREKCRSPADDVAILEADSRDLPIEIRVLETSAPSSNVQNTNNASEATRGPEQVSGDNVPGIDAADDPLLADVDLLTAAAQCANGAKTIHDNEYIDESHPSLAAQAKGVGAASAAHQAAQPEQWFVISSDEPGPEADRGRPLAQQPGVGSPACLAASRRHSPGNSRHALQPLDVNAGVLPVSDAKGIPQVQARALSGSCSPAKEKPAKARGRPRKDDGAAAASKTSPRKRGRPPKVADANCNPSPHAAKFKPSKAAVSALQAKQSPSSFLDIDEISDSDSPTTPSPPRRRATSTPPAIPALDIAVEGSPLAKLSKTAPALISAGSMVKLNDAQWPTVQEQIFPRISAAIHEAPRNINASEPNWQQKMLMYDPITLEDLTDWLNEQGLRIEVLKQKPKTKRRGRKKKGVDGEAAEEETAIEWEVHREQLQPWMVQRWCEERSICCVWAGGGWGGRARR